jgi:hypothetical protein
MHIHTLTYIHSHTHTYTHTFIHSHTHTYTHTLTGMSLTASKLFPNKPMLSLNVRSTLVGNSRDNMRNSVQVSLGRLCVCVCV